MKHVSAALALVAAGVCAVPALALGGARQGAALPTANLIQNPGGINLTAYWVGGAAGDHVTVINKTHGTGAAGADVTIVPPGAPVGGAQVMTLAGRRPGDATGTTVTLGGATITGDAGWTGRWSDLPPGPGPGIRLTVPATTAAIVKIPGGG